MKIFSIFIFAFVVFNVLEQHSTKYLLVEVEGDAAEKPPIIEVTPAEGTTTSPTTDEITTTGHSTATADYEFVHDGHCNGGWMDTQNAWKPGLSLKGCRDHCSELPAAGYFSYSPEFVQDCRCYSTAGGCPDGDYEPTFDSYSILRTVPKAKEGQTCKIPSHPNAVLPDCEEGLTCIPSFILMPFGICTVGPVPYMGGTGFRGKKNKCAKWKRKGTLTKQCRKPKHKNQPCCKQGGNDVDFQTVGSGEGSNDECQEKPKNVQKCKQKMAKWTRKNKVEKECNKLIGKKHKMKKCTCTCLKWKQGNQGSDEPVDNSEEPEVDPEQEPDENLEPEEDY